MGMEKDLSARSVVPVYSSVSGDLLVFPGPLYEVIKTLSELRRPVPGAVYVRDADPFVRFRKRDVIPPDILILLQLRDYIFRKNERFGDDIRDRLSDIRTDEAAGIQPDQTLYVCAGIFRILTPGGETSRIVIGIDPSQRAVDPAEAQGLFHRIVIRDAFVTGTLGGVDQPDLRSGHVVLREPFPPFTAISGTEQSAFIHFATS